LTVYFFNLAARYFLAISFLALRSRPSLIAFGAADAGLVQGLGSIGHCNVPDTGALFVTGGRFWPNIVKAAQDRTGKVLALRLWVGW